MTRNASRTDDARKRLAKLAETPQGATATIRQLLPEIEAAQAAGHSLAEIIETLGLDVSPTTFKNLLSRVRRERRESA